MLLLGVYSQQKENDLSKAPNRYNEYIYQDDVLDFIKNIPQETNKLDENEYLKKYNGQILFVNEYVIRTAAYKRDRAARKIKSATVIQLVGYHSPGSTIVNAYITFKKEGDLREPNYNEKGRVLYIEMRYEELSAVLSILNSPQKQLVCWYGEFDNGHIFSELYRLSSIQKE